jgi:hypothetical protein
MVTTREGREIKRTGILREKKLAFSGENSLKRDLTVSRGRRSTKAIGVWLPAVPVLRFFGVPSGHS